MIVYDIPKEFRRSIKLDLSNNFVYINSQLYYVSIRDKISNDELKFFALDKAARFDISKIIKLFGNNINVSVIFDSRFYIDVNYCMYDVYDYENVDYIRSF